MENFLSNLREKPARHRKRFAFLAAATITLFIFGFWSLTNFGTGGVLASRDEESEDVAVSPFESVRLDMASGLAAVKASFNELMSAFGSLGTEEEYERE